MKLLKQGVSRRQFLKTSGTASLMVSLAPGFALAAESAVIKKTIPSSGERLSVIGLGTSRTFDVDSDNAVTSPLMEVMQTFFDNGGQLIDSSPMYGSAEAVTGALVKRVKNKQNIFTATKVWTNGKHEGIEQMERSMRRLGVEQIDLMQIHNLRDWKTHIDTLSTGKPRAGYVTSALPPRMAVTTTSWRIYCNSCHWISYSSVTTSSTVQWNNACCQLPGRKVSPP
jgi:hypothetical protein